MTTIRLLPPRFVPIGFRRDGRPIFPVLGASSEDENDVELELEEGEEEPEPEEQEPEDDKGARAFVPPNEAEWVKVQAALGKANKAAQTRREELAAAKARLKELEDAAADREAAEERARLLAGGKKRKSAEGDEEPDTTPVLPEGVMTPAQIKRLVAQTKADAESATAARYHDIAVRQAAAAALAQAQVQSTNINRLTKLLDLNQVEMDEDGEVTGGLDEQISALREELPQLFKAEADPEPEPPKRTRPKAPRIPAAGAAPQQEALVPKTSAEKMADMVLGVR